MKITNEEERKLVAKAIQQRLDQTWKIRCAIPLFTCPICDAYPVRLPDDNGINRCTNEETGATCPVQVECDVFMSERETIMDKIDRLRYWLISLHKRVEE